MGITRVANVTGLDRIGIPVVMVCRPNSRSIAVSQGKGLDLDAARASGLMEAVETYHAERIELPLKLASLRDLAGAAPRGRRRRAAGGDARPLRPEPAAPVDRGPGPGLGWRRSGCPTRPCIADYTLPQPTGSGCFLASTNGLASGNHLLEAISHAICEVVERDCHQPLEPSASATARADPPRSRHRRRCRLRPGHRAPRAGRLRGCRLGHHQRHRHRRVLLPDRRPAGRAGAFGRRRRCPQRARRGPAARAHRSGAGAHHLHRRLARRSASTTSSRRRRSSRSCGALAP